MHSLHMVLEVYNVFENHTFRLTNWMITAVLIIPCDFLQVSFDMGHHL